MKALLPRRIRQKLGSVYRRYLAGGPVLIPSIYAEALTQTAIDPDLVFYESFYGRSMNCSPQAIFAGLLADPAHAGRRHVWALNDPSVLPESLRTHPAVSFVPSGGGPMRWPWHRRAASSPTAPCPPGFNAVKGRMW